MPSVTLICEECNHTARRELLKFMAGSRGIHETPSEPAMCPNGHGQMIRKDGFYCYSGTNLISKIKHLWRWESINGGKYRDDCTPAAIERCDKCNKTKPSKAKDDSECPGKST